MMIASKNAILRYRIIDKCIRSSAYPFPSKEELRAACEAELYGSSKGANICDSTIEKDIFAMRNEHDAPIKFSRRHSGYYYEDPNYTIDDIPLNEKDIDAIRMATNVLYQFKNSSLFENFDFAISKIIDRVNISKNVNDKAVDNFVQFEKVSKVLGGEYLETLLEAIKKKKKVQFEYQSFANTEKSLRRIHPYLLKEYRHRWYLIGKSEIKNRIQTFGLDRLQDLTVLDDKFSKETSFKPDLFFKHSIGITANVGEPEKIIIETQELLSKYLLSQPLHESQKYLGSNEENKHQFSYFLLPTYELKMQLLGYGDEVKILEPKSLVETIKTTCENVLKHYKS